ncbi:hypothetical protein ENTCAN_08866 [Enterobacter cancerogenus ATCC 35316]|nr:hypothetical protein ENTCAN_08866 [Enterobacter cancerogenus ATCC 35316]
MSFSSDTFAIYPTLFLSELMLCWICIRSSQHIKKNYCSNMNVCVGTLKKSHTGQNGRGKC